jgi:ketosteroid isomerase-like protein
VSTNDEVLEAAATLVEAFARGDLEAYFACFEPGASFVFHTTDRPLLSTEAYREEWARWVREDGLQILRARSSGQHVQDLGDVAVFLHDVETVTATSAAEATIHERETIVFRRQRDGSWKAVHEHLSPAGG